MTTPRASSAPESTRAFTPAQILVVYKKSKLDLYVNEKKNPRYAALLEAGAEVVEQLERAHEAHALALARVQEELKGRGLKFRKVYRARLRNDGYRGTLVITVGGDGTLLDASRKVREGVVMGLNSDPGRSVGFLCASDVEGFGPLLSQVLEGELAPTPVARLEASIDSVAIPTPILNDLLVCDRNPASTARYLIEHDGRREAHKSSGIWIAGPAGSTAALHSAGGQILPLSDGRMQVVVREPFQLEAGPHQLTQLSLSPEQKLVVVSKMREGRIFVDGPHLRHPFEVGSVLEVSSNGPPLRMIVTEQMRERRRVVLEREGVAPGGEKPYNR